MNSYVKSLEAVLADMYALYLKTQNYHWNAEGCGFQGMHELFEKQYRDLFTAIDDMAEIIRALGFKVVGTFSEFSKNKTIKDGSEKLSIQDMVKELADDQAAITKTMEKALKEAQKRGDEVVTGFLTERMTVHRKAGWLLRSNLAQK